MADIGTPDTGNSKNAGMQDQMAFNSSFLQSASFDKDSNQLTVNFKSGSQIVYQSVDASTWESWKLHPSKGSFYSRFIKKNELGSEVQSPLKVSDFTKAKEGKNKWQRLTKTASLRRG